MNFLFQYYWLIIPKNYQNQHYTLMDLGTIQLNTWFFFFLMALCLFFAFFACITSSFGEDSWSLGKCGGVFLSCTDKLNRRTLLVRPVSKQDPFSNFSGFFPSVRNQCYTFTVELPLTYSIYECGDGMKCFSKSFLPRPHILKVLTIIIACIQ